MIADEAVHQAVDADELRISLALVDTVIRDLFGVGLTLLNATSSMDEPARSAVSNAVDGIDGVIRTIREVAFDLHSPTTGPIG